MFRLLYIFAMISVGSAHLFSMDKYGLPPIYNQSSVNFRNLLNPEREYLERKDVELKTLRIQGKPYKKESLLNALSSTQKDEIEQLYHKIVIFFASPSPLYSDFINTVRTCNDVKKLGITEDHMGLFASYQDNVSFNQRTSLFFYFLKHYNKTMATTHEQPFATWSPLAKRLAIVPYKNNRINPIELLMNDTNQLLSKKINYYDEIVSFLHAKQTFKQLCGKCVLVGPDWKKKFIDEAFQLFCSKNFCDKVFDIVLMVNKAKELQLMIDESELGYYILSYKPALLDKMAMGSLIVSYESQQKKMALLCSCIKKYNGSRGQKVTPSTQLYHIYKELEPLHILPPDALDKNLLDPNKIAFKEYGELLDDITELKQSYDDAVEDCINVLYPA